jgi:hypothetical protein
MSVTAAVGYEFANSHDTGFGGFCQSFVEAQQECQANAAGDLRWAEVDTNVWAARDTVDGALYQIDQRLL